MATDPFTSTFVSALEARTHAYRFSCQSGEVVQFKYYCCDDPYNFSVTKPPVVDLDVSPDIQCTGVNVTFTLANSYVPLGTLASWTITYGDGGSAGGAWPPAPQVNAYAAAGVYNVRATATDTLGHTGNLTVQVLIVDCAAGSVLADYMYALSQTTGPWIRDMTAAVPAWVQQIDGLPAATNWLNGRDLKIDPHRRHLPVAGRHVWIATQAGVARSTDNMVHWTKLYDAMNEPHNSAGDGLPPTKAGLDWIGITFNPRIPDTVYVLAYDTVAPARTFVYYTSDGGATWDNWEVRY